MSLKSIQGFRSSSRYVLWRWFTFALMVLLYLYWQFGQTSNRRAAFAVLVLAGSSVAAAAAILAYLSARRFDREDTARRVWLLLALMALSDCVALIAFGLPVVFGSFSAAALLVILATVISSLSRVFVAIALWMMVRVYRQTGMRLHLRKRDYAAMFIIVAMGVAIVALSYNTSLAFSGPELARWVQFTGLPFWLSLTPCAVFGVMLWRYATQMGGGLVAKAWRNALLYAVLWLVRFTYLGIVVYELNKPTVTGLILSSVSNWMLGVSEYLLFLGASYQYEACASVFQIQEEELNAAVAERP